MIETTTHGIPAVRGRLGFGFLGGAVAWLAHLLLVWLISEFGCLGGLDRAAWLGLTVAAWLVIVVSVVLFAVSVAATAVAWVSAGRLPSRAAEAADEAGSERFLARAGWITSGLFAGVIVVQTIPVLFYLQTC